MCGRYAGADTFEGLSPKLKKGLRKYKASNQFYNAAPSNHLPVITSQEPDSVQEMQWGLVRRYEKDYKAAFKPINARAETLLDKPTFHDLLKKNRCVIPANSFYELELLPLTGGKMQADLNKILNLTLVSKRVFDAAFKKMAIDLSYARG